MSRVSSPFASRSNGIRRSALASLLAAAFLCAGLIQAEASSAGTLTVEKDGTGQGTVTSSPAGINCGTGCTSQQAFFSGSVTLTATPASGSDFAGWPGCDSPSGNSCTMNMANANKLVLASFSVRRTLNFSKFGQGTVTSSPAGVNCGSGCTSQSPQFSDGTQVTLTATPAAGWVFAGWPGCDNLLNNGSCRMTMNSTKFLEAHFVEARTLNFSKFGQGTVTSSPAGINCGTGCTNQNATYGNGTEVTLTATPAAGWVLAGWPGCDNVQNNGTCRMTMNSTKFLEAHFVEARTLNFSKFGQGTVTSSPAGINCGTGCTGQNATYGNGTEVTLTATPAAGWVFAGWPGCDSLQNNGSCRMNMTSTKFLEAHFVEARTLSFSKFGQGTVTSSPAGINCGTGCSTQNATYGHGTEVTLTATPAAGWVLAGWPGCDNVLNNGSCKMNMTSTKFLEAHFVQLRTVTVAKNGTGTGTVTSSPSGINCGNACSAQYGDGTEVTFTATPDSTSTFAGWSGCDTVTNAGLCRVTANGTENVTATFALKRTLTVLRDGSGTGGVASSPAGISCSPTCSAQFTEGQSVSLQPTASQGSVFGGWTGCDSLNGNICTVAMSTSRSVTATFTAQHVLGVVKSGSGGGTVTSSPGGIACGSTCSAPFNQGTTVTLTAAPDAGSLVGGWTGCDSTTATTCTVAMDDAAQVTASFVPQRALTVTKGGSGAGSVSSSPAGISCGVTCEAAFADGATVVLTATPTSGSDFAGWTGCDSTNGPTCTVAMNAARGVTAAFSARRMLTVTKSGSGTGTVGSSPAGINCGATCAALFGEGQTVVLVAAPAQGSSFAGWSGCDSTNGANCSVAMTGDGGRDVVATFTKLPAPSKTVPNTTITSGPKRTRSRTVTFKFSSSVAGSAFRCSLDGGKPVACRSSKTYANLAVGKHTFRVFAVSRGVSDPTPAVRTFRILPRRRR